MAVAKAIRKLPPKLVESNKLKAASEPFQYLWQWFLELQSSESLTYTEIEAWSRLTGRRVTGTEAKIIRQLDSLYLRIINERHSLSSN